MAELQRTVLPQHLAGGPHNLGDPNDRTLRKVETGVLIPKRMREVLRTDKCLEEVREFTRCCNEHDLMMVVKCKSENSIMKDCMMKWFYNDEFRKEITEIYLKERSEYRRTGIPQNKQKRH